jgi:hypothetical protein
MFVNPSKDPAVVAEGRRLGIRRGFRRDKARALPMLLVKRFGSKGRLKTSETPVSVLDVPATIFAELGVEANPTGVSVFQTDGNQDRTRRYGAFDFRASKGDYVSPIVFYSVTGDSWLDESWNIEGIYPPPTQE